MRYFLSVFFLLVGLGVSSQTVYRTPSGKKYHTATCRYVKNVSHSLSLNDARKSGLTACSQCGPESGSKGSNNSRLGIKSGEAKGQNFTASQCRGTTKAGARCKRTTKNKNGYCFQHEP